jgi:membrane fusion protein
MARSLDATDLDADAPFLSAEPPPMVARALATVLIALFASAVIAAVVVRVPETVAGRFVLVPLRGADPVRALRQGQVVEVGALEGDEVALGAPLFVVRSDLAADRSADLGVLREQLRGSEDAARLARRGYEERRRADEQQGEMLKARIAALDRAIPLKAERARMTAELAERFRSGTAQGTISPDEYVTRRLEATRLAEEQAMLEGDRAQAAAELEKLRHERDARDAEFRDLLRRLAEARSQSEIRAAALTPETPAGSGGGAELVVRAPCAGTVVRLRVRGPGAVVQQGEVLGEIACAGVRLQAEVTLPPGGVARVREGHPVKLLYDAFPYQRYGVRVGRVRWVSPAATSAGGGAGAADGGTSESDVSFRALVDLRDADGGPHALPRALLAGMGGTARVVVERRPLASYAFEPIRQLRENLSGGEEP